MACSPGVSATALNEPQSSPAQLGVATWLYRVEMYQPKGQPSEKSLSARNRPAAMKLNRFAVRGAVRHELYRRSILGRPAVTRPGAVIRSALVGGSPVLLPLPLVRSENIAVPLRPSLNWLGL